MAEDISLETQLWKLNRESFLTKQSWTEIIGRLVSSLTEFLEQTVELNEISIEDIQDGDKEAVALIYGAEPFGGPLSIAWQGALRVDLQEDRPYIGVSIFLFCLRKRLCIAEHEAGSFLELILEPTLTDFGKWKVIGWLEDIYYEYTDIDECSTYD
jgi:hypothetical protein